MADLKPMVHWQTNHGEPVTVRDVTVTPVAQALMVRWPNGGLVWNRPVAVLVRRGPETQRLPIVDVSRLAQWILWGLALLFLWNGFRSRK